MYLIGILILVLSLGFFSLNLVFLNTDSSSSAVQPVSTSMSKPTIPTQFSLQNSSNLSIFGPSNLSFALYSVNNYIVWNLTHTYTVNCSIYRNYSLIQSFNQIMNDSIIIRIDGLSLGVYNFTIYAFDTQFQTTTNTVFVTVYNNTNSYINIYETIQNPYINHLYVYSLSRNISVDCYIDHNNPVNYTISVDGTSVFNKSMFIYSGIAFSTPMSPLFTIGSHNITLYAIDTNHVVGFNSINITILQPSSAHFLTPPTIFANNNSVYPHGTYHLYYSFNKSFESLNYSVAYVVTLLYPNGGMLSTSFTSYPGSLDLYPGILPDGNYLLTIAAFDSYGLESDSVLYFSVGSPVPNNYYSTIPNILSPTNNSVLSGSIVIKFNASYPLNHTIYYHIVFHYTQSNYSFSFNINNTSFSYNTTTLANGNWIISVSSMYNNSIFSQSSTLFAIVSNSVSPTPDSSSQSTTTTSTSHQILTTSVPGFDFLYLIFTCLPLIMFYRRKLTRNR